MVLQANVNRSKPSLDLLLHQAKEIGVGLLLISEPNYIPDSEGWFASKDGSATIFVDLSRVKLRCLLVRAGPRFVVIQCGPYMVISVYVSPRIGLREFNVFLDKLSEAMAARADKIICGGNFNAKATLWGASSTDGRGLLLTRWAAERDLRIANIGNNPTCVRPQSNSVVDLTWVSPDLLYLVREWYVRNEMESLSDHLYISFSVCSDRLGPPPNRMACRRWNAKKFDADLFQAILNWRGLGPPIEDHQNVQRMAKWLDRIMEEAYDAT